MRYLNFSKSVVKFKLKFRNIGRSTFPRSKFCPPPVVFAVSVIKITVDTIKCTGAHCNFSSATGNYSNVTSNYSNAVFCV